MKLMETQKLLQEMSSSKIYLKIQKKLIIAEQLYWNIFFNRLIFFFFTLFYELTSLNNYSFPSLENAENGKPFPPFESI